jgi:hypothetical protein
MVSRRVPEPKRLAVLCRGDERRIDLHRRSAKSANDLAREATRSQRGIALGALNDSLGHGFLIGEATIA